MPRRKQDTPQRLKSKAGTEPPANASEAIADSGAMPDCDSHVKENYGNMTSEKISEPKRTDDIDDRAAERKLKYGPEGGKCATAVANLNGEESTAVSNTRTTHIETAIVQNSSKRTEEKVSAQMESSLAPARSEKVTLIAPDDDSVAHSSDTSLLHTLAAAAAFRSTTPSKSSSTAKDEDRGPTWKGSSIPIKKRAKRSLTPSDMSLKRTDECPSTASPKRRYHPESTDYVTAARIAAANHMYMSSMVPDVKDEAGTGKQATQLHLMEAMMHRQRQLYDECADNNWMKMQRTDHNCLSKSKAERYRWCVQENMNSGSVKNSQTPMTGDRPTVGTNPSYDVKKSSTITRQSNPMQDKLYSTVFSGASKFRCRDCGSPFNTLVDLTVHMNKTGHYRDQNIADMKLKGHSNQDSIFAKPKKRSLMEMEEKESAEKVLKCLGCGHSFDSLQDLSVHMMKTKHYEDVPSLRFYSQKNDFCSTTANQQSQDDKTFPPQRNNNNIAAAQSSDSEPSSTQHTPFVEHSKPELKAFDYALRPPMFSAVPNIANMQALAAQSLLGFSPYLMPMPFAGSLNGYGAPNPAIAAAASLFLSAPWLAQMPGLGATNMFSPFLNPRPPLPTPLITQPKSMSPVSRDDFTPSPLTSPFRSSNTPNTSPVTSKTAQPGSSRFSNDYHRSKAQVLRCHQCEMSFNSLQKLTNHMQEATHFPDPKHLANGVGCSPRRMDLASPKSHHEDEAVPHGRSRKSPTVESPSRSRRSPSLGYVGPTSSPLEHLAKLASGKSLGQINKPSSDKLRNSIKSSKTDKHKTSPTQATSSNCQQRRKSIPVAPCDKYLRPETPQDGQGRSMPSSTPTGFDFIKSLESTIQSAISKVNDSSKTSHSSVQDDLYLGLTSRSKNHSEASNLPPRPAFNLFTSSINTSVGDQYISPAGSPRSSLDKGGEPKCTPRKTPSPIANDRTVPSNSSPNQSVPNSVSDQINANVTPGKDSSPLDLTKPTVVESKECSLEEDEHIEVDEVPSPRPKLAPNPLQEQHGSNIARRSAANNQGPKDPLQCIEDNMQSLFSLKKSKSREYDQRSGPSPQHEINHGVRPPPTVSKQRQDVAVKNEPSSLSICASSARKPPYDVFSELQRNQANDKVKTNPLKEIQKIVNSTEITRRPESLTEVAAKDDKHIFTAGRNSQINRKRTAECDTNNSTKRYKPGSVLSDLVTHEDDSPPSINPLAQMEHLVNLRIVENLSPAQKKVSTPTQPAKKSKLSKLYFPDVTNGIGSQSLGSKHRDTNPMSALLSIFDGNNGMFKNTFQQHNSQAAQSPENSDSQSEAAKAIKKSKRLRNHKSKHATLNGKQISEAMSPPDDTVRLRDKMADFFRSMVGKDQSKAKSPMENGYVDRSRASDPSPMPTANRTVGELSPGRYNSDDSITESALRPEQELQLQYHCVSNLDRFKGTDFPKFAELEKMSRITRLPKNVVKAWVATTRKQLSEGECGFIKTSSAEDCYIFRCIACERFSPATSSAVYLQHLSTHLGLGPRKYLSQDDSESESDLAKSDWKMLYRGAMRFAPLTTDGTSYALQSRASETSSPEKPLMRSFSPFTTDEVVHDKRHCVDGLKVTEDSPIQVSG